MNSLNEFYYFCKRILKMKIPQLHSLKTIERKYNTGEEPVLVVCSNLNSYICKYMRSSAASYKLASELIGSQMAALWRINTPESAIVIIKAEHWKGLRSTHSISAPTFGSRKKSGVIDVTPTMLNEIEPSPKLLYHLAFIALFDFWMANEDRNANNYNLMYDVNAHLLVPIDYGCVFNTATYDYPLSQLTETDSILSSKLFEQLASRYKREAISLLADLNKHYGILVNKCHQNAKSIIAQIPQEWNLPMDAITDKVNSLFDSLWLDKVWLNFLNCLKEKVRLW